MSRAATGEFGVVGSRTTVFDGPPPPVILVEPGRPIEVAAETDALVAMASAPGGPVSRTALVMPDEIQVEHRGEGQTARRIHHLLPPAAEAGRLIAFEVFTPGGNWSSYPPHKHDTEDPPTEARLEEIYFYRFARPQGFAFQRVYTPDRSLDESLAPGDGDIVLVPAGFHPVAAAAGYDCYYLNVMAGPNRAWNFTLDPDHAWLMNWQVPAPQVRTGGGIGMTVVAMESPLLQMTRTTPTDYWNDSCAVDELAYAIERGATGRDLEPGDRRRGHEEGEGALGPARARDRRRSTPPGPRSRSPGR